MKVFLTFDLDLADYISHRVIDEFAEAVPIVRENLARFPAIRTSWFVRLDCGIESRFGKAEYCLEKHHSLWAALRDQGNEVGWHFHPSGTATGASKHIEINEQVVVKELCRFCPVAREHGLCAVRMGHGYQSNSTISILEEAGFRVDSSAIPRPRYPWDTVPCDWSRAPQEPFRPSRTDYQRPGADARNIVELPISTVPLPCVSDTLPNVQRYLNPAYRHDAFVQACDAASERNVLTLIMHPYEIVSRPERHHLLAFDDSEFRRNLEYLGTLSTNFHCVSDAAALC